MATKNSILLWNFYPKFSQIFQTIVFFVKTRENLTQGFDINLKKDRNSAVLLFSTEFFENILKCFSHLFFVQSAKMLLKVLNLLKNHLN